MRIRWLGALVVVAAGCYRPASERECSVFCDHTVMASPCPDGLTCGADDRCYDTVQCDQRPLDAAVGDDSSSDALDTCPGLGWLHFCPANPHSGSETMPPTFNTSTMCTEIRQSPGGPLCVYAVTGSLTVSGNVAITGPRPLVLVADRITIEMSGILDVADGGAGAGPAACADPVSGGIGVDSCSGGAGGSFVSAGGIGGMGTTSIPQTPNPGTVPSFLRGGCAGGAGGHVLNEGMSPGGKGGGAIYLMASQEIVMSGSIYAWGGGGEGGTGGNTTTGGGGGGGSGGHIVLDAPTITLRSTAHLLAEGGGGGAGGARGVAGDPGMVIGPSPTHAGFGGVANPLCAECGDGGNGSFGSQAGFVGNAASNAFGGAGGGGGGGGEIHWFFHTPFLDVGVISPTPVGSPI
ncbi:MAG: hypothetical protein IPQ07_21785 [Myxococcales bacterium]|nr:hypothetical protein [Myxococcales bacterium]